MKTRTNTVEHGTLVQIADGTMVTTLQILEGTARLHIADEQPTLPMTDFLVMSKGDVIPMAQNVKAWMMGDCTYTVVSVEPATV